MKKAILSFGLMMLALVAFNTVSAQTVGGAMLELDKEVHDYGTMEQGGNGECVFTITNKGTEPLTISRCKGSCGCTVPQCPKEPIAPGATSEIKVKYDTKRVGPINKSVTIESNATDNAVKVIRIKGNITAAASADPSLKPAGPVSK